MNLLPPVPRQGEDRLQSTGPVIAQTDLPPVCLGDVPRDAKAESCSACLPTARAFQAIERLEHLVDLRSGIPGPWSRTRMVSTSGPSSNGSPLVARRGSVVDQVREAALEQWGSAVRPGNAALDSDGPPHRFVVGAKLSSSPMMSMSCAGSRLDRPRMNSSVCVTIASISSRSASNSRAADVLQQLRAQSHPGQRRLEVVGHRGEERVRSSMNSPAASASC